MFCLLIYFFPPLTPLLLNGGSTWLFSFFKLSCWYLRPFELVIYFICSLNCLTNGSGKKGSWCPYEGLYLQEFDNINTRLWGYAEIMILVGEGKDAWHVSSQFLVVPCRSVYNCILERPFAVTLNFVASPIHLKLKYHNLQGDPITIKVDLEWEKRIYQALQRD